MLWAQRHSTLAILALYSHSVSIHASSDRALLVCFDHYFLRCRITSRHRFLKLSNAQHHSSLHSTNPSTSLLRRCCYSVFNFHSSASFYSASNGTHSVKPAICMPPRSPGSVLPYCCAKQYGSGHAPRPRGGATHILSRCRLAPLPLSPPSAPLAQPSLLALLSASS